jgi:hypothetical protein
MKTQFKNKVDIETRISFGIGRATALVLEERPWGFFEKFYKTKHLCSLKSLRWTSTESFYCKSALLQLKQQSHEIIKLAELIEVDDKIVALRSNISNTAKAQHEKGVISTNDLLRELNAEDQAIQNRLLHQIQLQLSQYAYQNISGN